MRDLHYYPTIEQYRESVRSKFLPMFLKNRFYSNLIDYTIENKAPIFYTISHPSEHFAFSGAYHFETQREKYPNLARRNLFWLHDFTHMLFPYAWDVYNVSEATFQEQFVYQERIASTETEVFAYYRIPELRDLVFPDETLYYDVMRERGKYGLARGGGPLDATKKPDPYFFLSHRNKLVLYDDYGEAELGEYPEILHFFQQWRRLTPQWVHERYKSMVGKRIPNTMRETFNVTNYEGWIESYEPKYMTQDKYERVMLDNVIRAYAMLGWDNPPTKWRHVPSALHSLEGAVFFQ